MELFALLHMCLNTNLRWRKRKWNASVFPTLTPTADHHPLLPTHSHPQAGVYGRTKALEVEEGKREEATKKKRGRRNRREHREVGDRGQMWVRVAQATESASECF